MEINNNPNLNVITFTVITHDLTDGKYDGVAPNGKIVVIDLGTANSGLAVPGIQALYGPGYNAGLYSV